VEQERRLRVDVSPAQEKVTMRRESHSRLKFLLESIQELDLEFRREEIRVEMGRRGDPIIYLI